MIDKIYSGGEVGAEKAALDFAKTKGIATDGYMTLGCKTIAGPKPEYKTIYGLKENASNKYKDKAKENIKNVDAVLYFSDDRVSCLMLSVKNEAAANGKRFLKVNVRIPMYPEKIADWLNNNNIKKIYITGATGNGKIDVVQFVTLYLNNIYSKLKT